MTQKRLRTVLVGLGKVGAGYANDPLMAGHYPYATHAQVLADHPAFAWEAILDIDDAALKAARLRWNIPIVAHNAEELARFYQPEIAVIATPPESRNGIIEWLPSLRAVLVEKPLGPSLKEGRDFLDRCEQRGVRVQCNLWRRADESFRSLAGGELARLIGKPQAVYGIYGNGLRNNGTHMIDFVRMLFGEVGAAQAISGIAPYSAGPLRGDVHIAFTLRLHDSLVVMMQPVRFEWYRENGLDIWGEKARLSILQEGLGISLYPRRANRAMQCEWEIASDFPQARESTVGHAYYRMYTNLAASVRGEAAMWSPGESALQTERVIEAVIESAQNNGKSIELS